MKENLNLDPKAAHIALLVLDQQLDFEPGGALPVAEGDQIVTGISQLMLQFKQIVMAQDTHPLGHISFASSHGNKLPYDSLRLSDLEDPSFSSNFSPDEIKKYLLSIPDQIQTLWPDHCVPGSEGWKIDPRLPIEKASLILRKGDQLNCDSYSAFRENNKNLTGLNGYLKEKKVELLYLVGLTGDYCVYWSAMDAVDLGFKVIYDQNLTRFVDPKSKDKVLRDLSARGVLIK